MNFFKTQIQYFLFALLVFQTLNIIGRHIFQIKRFLVNVQAFQDTLIMICAIATLTMYAYRSIRIKQLLELISRSKFNKFQNFDEVISLEWWSNLTTGIWCSQNLLHLIDVFHFNSHIRIFYYTLLYALEYIHMCICLTILFLVSFSTAFHYIIGQENYLYHQIFLSYIQMFATPFTGYPTMEFEYTNFLSMIPYCIWTYYGYTFRFMVTTMFCIVLNNSYHRARLRLFNQNFKYSINLYLKERVFNGKIGFDGPRMVPIGIKKHKKKKQAAAEQSEEINPKT